MLLPSSCVARPVGSSYHIEHSVESALMVYLTWFSVSEITLKEDYRHAARRHHLRDGLDRVMSVVAIPLETESESDAERQRAH